MYQLAPSYHRPSVRVTIYFFSGFWVCVLVGVFVGFGGLECCVVFPNPEKQLQ